MADWTAPDFIDQLATAVAARPGITAMTPTVRVVTYYPSDQESGSDWLILGWEAADVNAPAAVGQNRWEETVVVRCEARVLRAGAGDSIAADARERVDDLLGEIDNQLRAGSAGTPTWPDVGDQTIDAGVTRRAMVQLPGHDSKGIAYRACVVDFDITYRSRTSITS